MKLVLNAGYLPKGFLAAGIQAGLKRRARRDLGLLYSGAPCSAAAMFTANKVEAAPVTLSRRHARSGTVQAVIVNSGNANCMTGAQGMRAAETMAAAAASVLRLKPAQVLVASTGIIGRQLPVDKVLQAVPRLVEDLHPRGFSRLADAIGTTDTFRKEAAVSFSLGGVRATLCGVAKGAGMIAPRMRLATMLSFLATDAAVAPALLRTVLREAVEGSFNAITVDGCMSTNDMVVALANGAAGNRPVRAGSRDHGVLAGAMRAVCTALAKMIVQDAEGATKFITIDVTGASDGRQAEALAFAVANSVLFKTAMAGSNPNWGRIAAALGSIPARVDARKMTIALNGRIVLRAGRPVPFEKKDLLRGREVHVVIRLGQGKAAKRVWTSDLSYGYVRINAAYN
ncbi:MAG: bifunctional glutamate N-acetyltransferase/amino-acid acetyltransferase ArgJ [Deltaproteobacteria bacterium]